MNLSLKKIGPYEYEIPQTGKMLVPGKVFAYEAIIEDIIHDGSIEQVINVAHLPGIVKASFAMPDIHSGYGFPIGGVAAFDKDTGIISPGGVGYDINCGVRLLGTNCTKDQILPKIISLTENLFYQVPSGIGAHRKDLKLSPKELKNVLREGALWAIHHGYGFEEDSAYSENT